MHHFAAADRLRRRRRQPLPRLRDDQRPLQPATSCSSPVDYTTAEKNYVKALHKGVLKVMSKMGISTLQSYRGAQIFEAVGLRQEFVDQLLHLDALAHRRHRHRRDRGARRGRATRTPTRRAPIAGNLDLQAGRLLPVAPRRRVPHVQPGHDRAAAALDAHATTSRRFEQFTDLIDNESRRLCTIRGLLDFKPGNPIPIDEVEPAQEIVKRFATGAASLGSISREAHETMAIAMNRIGARSNTGEGGEDYHRYTPDANGDSRQSAIKQVASGRFGVTANYLAHATDLQIKMAQGSKPGEGGQLPGHKVDDYIGWVRHTTPGVELISPPPHHDIYSIEDLASADPRPQELEPDGAHPRQAGLRVRRRHDRGRRLQGPRRRRPDQRRQRRHRRLARVVDQERRPALGARRRRDAAGAGRATTCAAASSCRRTVSSRPAATSPSPACSAPRSSASRRRRWSSWAASCCASATSTPARSASPRRTRSCARASPASRST